MYLYLMPFYMMYSAMFGNQYHDSHHLDGAQFSLPVHSANARGLQK